MDVFSHLNETQKSLVPILTQVTGWWLQLPIEAALGGGVAAVLVRMLAVESYVLPVRNHSVRDVERPALLPADHHAAPLGWDVAASWESHGEVV